MQLYSNKDEKKEWNSHITLSERTKYRPLHPVFPQSTHAGVSLDRSPVGPPKRSKVGFPIASWGIQSRVILIWRQENCSILFIQKYGVKSLLVTELSRSEDPTCSLHVASRLRVAPIHPCSLNKINLVFLVLLPGRSATSIFSWSSIR